MLLAATLAAGGGGCIALKLARRWPFTATVVMTGLTLALVIAVALALDPYDGSGPIDALTGGLIAGAFLSLAPLVAPGLCLFVVAGSATWVAAVRIALTGSPRVGRTGDARQPGTSWQRPRSASWSRGPVILLGITLLTGTDCAD